MKLRRKGIRRKKLLVMSVVMLFCLTVPAFAIADSTDTESILSRYPLESNSMVSNVMRSIGWAIVKGLNWLVGGLETCIYSINDAIGGFFTSDAVVKLENQVFPIALALWVIVILFIGILSMFKPPNFSHIAGNFVIGVVVFFSLPYLLSTAYQFTFQAIDYIDGNAGSISLMSNKVLVDNMTDTTRYDAEGFKSTTLQYKNYFTLRGADESQITSIDINELVDPGKMKNQDVWKNRVVTDHDGNKSLQGLSSGQYGPVNIPMMSQYYYRWNIDWFTILITLIVTAAALLLSGIKIARLIYELAINQTMAQVMALLDVVTAQRLKKCIQMLISTLGTLFAVFFMLQMYILGTSYVSSRPNLNIFVRILLMLALAFAVIDGPNLFEQIFGVDAGIKSGMRTLYGLKSAAGLISGGVALMGGKAALDTLRNGGILGTARKVLSGTGSVAGSVGGAVAGVARGAADNRQRVGAVRQAAGSVASAVGGAVAGAAAGAAKAGQPNDASERNSPDQSSGQPVASTANPQETVESKRSAAERQTAPSDIPPRGQEGGGPNQAAERQQSSDSSANPEPQVTKSSKPQTDSGKTNQVSPPGTIGEYVRSKVSNGIRNSAPATHTRHVYGLTRGSLQKHGDKLVERERQAQSYLQSNSDLSHRQAVRQAKRDIRKQ